ncbi:hypothetical protein [Absidia glauca]|uniref:Uncharacterized protein n=1 Tax=Absidia glauca TaxID=4829 RepID=A0A163JC07_ABSGL|nr:hypothetical protein [Absidia glauca]
MTLPVKEVPPWCLPSDKLGTPTVSSPSVLRPSLQVTFVAAIVMPVVIVHTMSNDSWVISSDKKNVLMEV